MKQEKWFIYDKKMKLFVASYPKRKVTNPVNNRKMKKNIQDFRETFKNEILISYFYSTYLMQENSYQRQIFS